MLSIAKLQNLKAIHNGSTRLHLTPAVVINHKTTKFESNSQPGGKNINVVKRCYQSQNYKIWKQFTTLEWWIDDIAEMLSITKLQNLKAIHNYFITEKNSETVVINHKTTKFESNSQRNYATYINVLRCYQSQNYKIWKQFTTFFA